MHILPYLTLEYICLSYCMMSFVLGSSMSFFRSHDPVTMTVICDITLTPSFKFQNKNKRRRK